MNNIKILHLFNDYLPQTENWAYNLIASLPDCEIHIGGRTYLKNNFYNSQFYFVDNHFEVFNQIDKSLGKKKSSNLIKKLFLKSISFIFGGLQNSIIDYGRRENIQLVHAHFADNAWYFKNIAQQLKVPFFVSFYGWDYEKLPYTKPEYQEYFKALFKIADQFICEGKHGASILAKYGCPAKKISVVPLGIQVDKVKFIARSKIPNQLKLIQVASFTEKKGHFYAIEALSSIINECPNIELTFIGNDSGTAYKEKLKQQVQKLQLSDKIHFLPAIDYKNLYTTLSAYDVFIHPSCYAENRDCEGGAPIVLLDAQATGMPIIATTHCDIPDEVVHQKTGLLSPEKNIDELAKSIKNFYQMDGTSYNKFAENARQHVEEKFAIRRNAAVLKDIYYKILNNQ